MRNTNKSLSFDQTKMLVLQIESVRTQANDQAKNQTATMAANVKIDTTAPKCFNCDEFGHIERNYSHTCTGLRVCFECKQLTRHIVAQCPQRLAKDDRQNFNRRYESRVVNTNNRYRGECRGNKRKNERKNDSNAKRSKLNDFRSQNKYNRQD